MSQFKVIYLLILAKGNQIQFQTNSIKFNIRILGGSFSSGISGLPRKCCSEKLVKVKIQINFDTHCIRSGNFVIKVAEPSFKIVNGPKN